MTSIIYLVWAMLCHDPSHIPGKTDCPLTHIVINSSGPGDTGIPPIKPPTGPQPPPPPPPTGG